MGEGQAALSGSRRFPLGDYKSTMRLSRVLLPAVAAKRAASAQSLPTQSQKREKPVGRTPAGRVRLLTRMGVTRPGDDLPEDWVQHPQVRCNNLLSAAPGISPELPGYPRL